MLADRLNPSSGHVERAPGLRIGLLLQEVDLPDPAPNVMVIPLLFISPIENAFKHGVNNRRPSFVRIRLTWEEGQIVFQIENSRHPKAETDRVGSGIGIENLRRRLELAYPGRHAYRQSQTDKPIKSR